jgi:hydrogen peroxide-dependent heme synthase
MAPIRHGAGRSFPVGRGQSAPMQQPHTAPPAANEAPQTAEGWYILHDQWTVDWSLLRHLESHDRDHVAQDAAAWLAARAERDGGSACYAVLGQDGDLLLVHYRKTVEALHAVQAEFRRSRLHEFCKPARSFVSVVEVSLYEAAAIAQGKLAAQGIRPDDARYASAYEAEFAKHKAVLEGRLWRSIPAHRHLCWYPMSKRRGETKNWYALPMDERRALMRGHGRIGHKYHEQVVQVIGGAIGLDDWEWSVDLHAEDPLVFKRLVTEMRFDPASSWYAEFGPFYLGLRRTPAELADLLCQGF